MCSGGIATFHMTGFQSFLMFLHHFLLPKLATSSIRANKQFTCEICMGFLTLEVMIRYQEIQATSFLPLITREPCIVSILYRIANIIKVPIPNDIKVFAPDVHCNAKMLMSNSLP